MTTLPRIFPPTSSRRASNAHNGSFEWFGAFSKVTDTLQKYQDIPRRFQKQWLTTFIGGLLFVGVVSGIYLNLTARAGITGRQIQELEASIIVNQRANADLQTKIAGTLSKISLEDRAVAAGFEPVTRDNITYLEVPGYFPQQKTELFSPSEDTRLKEFPPQYSETLFVWLARQLEAASTPLARTQ